MGASDSAGGAPAMTSARARCLPRSSPAAAAVLALTLSMAACAGGEVASLERDEFVAVVVQIRELERRVIGSDSASPRFEREKAKVLEEHGVTEEELREFVRLHGGDVELMRTIWDSIDSRLTRTPTDSDSGSAPGDSAPVRRRLRVEDGAADSAMSSGTSTPRPRRAPMPPPDPAPTGG